MPPRKKNAEPPAPASHPASEPAPAPLARFDVSDLLRVGGEQVMIDHEENDNIAFMSALIDRDRYRCAA